MQHHLIRLNGFPCADITHHIARQISAFRFINLPANNFAAKNIHEQIQVKIEPLTGVGKYVMSQQNSWFGAVAQSARGL